MKIPKLTVYQIIVEVLSILLVLGGTVYTIAVYPSLPAEIPGHFNAAGEATSYTGKGTIFFLMGMNILMYAGMTLCILFPKVVENPNMPWPMNPFMKGRVSYETICLVSECKLLCIAMFDYMLYEIAACVEMPVWPIFAVIAVMTLLMIIRMKRLSKCKKTV